MGPSCGSACLTATMVLDVYSWGGSLLVPCAAIREDIGDLSTGVCFLVFLALIVSVSLSLLNSSA